MVNQPLFLEDADDAADVHLRARRPVQGGAVGGDDVRLQPQLGGGAERGNEQPGEGAAGADGHVVTGFEAGFLEVTHQQRRKIGVEGGALGLEYALGGGQGRPLWADEARAVDVARLDGDALRLDDGEQRFFAFLHAPGSGARHLRIGRGAPACASGTWRHSPPQR